MTTAENEKKRIKQRFEVELKAEASLAEDEAQKYQCRLTNLSASGACLHFETTAPCKVGISIAMKLFIPGTIMHIPNSGEIIWVKQQPDEIHAGIRFTEILSEIMMQRLVINGIPEAPYNPE